MKCPSGWLAVALTFPLACLLQGLRYSGGMVGGVGTVKVTVCGGAAARLAVGEVLLAFVVFTRFVVFRFSNCVLNA